MAAYQPNILPSVKENGVVAGGAGVSVVELLSLNAGADVST